MEFVQLDDCRLRYERAGSGSALVFVHGFGLDHRLWQPQFEHFAATHDVVRYDLRGFGGSLGALENGYRHGADLCGVLDRLGIERATLVGLSMGGQVALEVAVSDPERVAGLVLVDSYLADFDFSEDWRGMWGSLAKLAASRGVESAKETWSEAMLFSVVERVPAAGRLLRAMMDDWSGWHLQHPGHFPYTPVSPRLGEIDAPALVVVGELDLQDFLGISALLEQRIEPARRVVVPAVGHVPNLEDPEGFNALLEDFLG